MSNIQTPPTLLEMQREIMRQYAERYLFGNHFADDPFVVETPLGMMVVQQFYADEAHGGMYGST
jgi:hypothetical protein